ncbi:hypothetical protein SDC9_170129 [bioreactor metagenome]|uniref:DUF5651 domain-containing protein n=1 Tax=bioreactor metagenome TaxID=1076179 RepID=A0A645G9F4_9ZZZZ
MKPYLSRDEKEYFIRLSAMMVLLEEAIASYAKANSTDKEFLKLLRTGRTNLQKALQLRGSALEPSAKQEFLKQSGRLEFMCLPKPEALKANKELLALRSVLPMKIQDFEDWYSVVIEGTCKVCQREDYAECLARRVMTDYGVYPVNPDAVSTCQYSYIDEEPQGVGIVGEAMLKALQGRAAG